LAKAFSESMVAYLLEGPAFTLTFNLAWPKSGETLHPPKKKKQFAVRFRRLKMKPTHSFSLCIGCQVFFK
jgi:formate hydrogenlyase subunit 6/NADH:ubiquinone oxidoreductase subunit I